MLPSHYSEIQLGLSWAGGEYQWQSTHVIASLTLGFVVFVVFIVWEWKGSKLPLIPRKLHRPRENSELAGSKTDMFNHSPYLQDSNGQRRLSDDVYKRVELCGSGLFHSILLPIIIWVLPRQGGNFASAARSGSKYVGDPDCRGYI